MNAGQDSPMQLPPYKMVGALIGSQNSWRPQTPVNPFAPKTWTGVPINSHPFTTPVLYHQGSWVASYYLGADPEAPGPDLWKQYGHGVGPQSCPTRAPVSIIINGFLSSYFTQVVHGVVTIAGIMNNAAILKLLNANRVFVGISKGNPSFTEPYTMPFPDTGEVADPKPFQSLWKKRLFDSSKWSAGRMLHLGALRIETGCFGSGSGTGINDGAFSTAPFYSVNYVFNPLTTTWTIDDGDSASYYKAAANLAADDVPLLKSVIYFIMQQDSSSLSGGRLANYNTALNLMKSKVDTIGASWMTVKKYFTFNAGAPNMLAPDDDLTDPLTADVLSFLEGL